MNTTTATELVSSPFAFDQSLSDTDPQLQAMMDRELDRQQKQIELIASENIVSQAVLEAQGSVLTNKYAEGYPGRRYYGGCEFVDQVEQLAIDRAKRLFDCKEAIVQPHSGSQANQCVFMALLKPGAKIMGLDLAAGGHLTHGAKVNQSGKWFNAVHYGVRDSDDLIDMDLVRDQALAERPDLIIAGGSAYSRIIDFAAFRAIADEIGAYFLVDMAHFAGLVAGGHYPSPVPHAHAVTSTTHKTLRGPRGGIVLTNDKDLAKKFRSALFPGIQGGPLMHVVAGKAAAFGEALTPEYKVYTKQVIENAKALASVLVDAGYAVVSGGTDTHVVLVDLRPKGVKGNAAEEALERAGITVNKNTVPGEKRSPMVTSGIRIGTPAITTRGFDQAACRQVADWIAEVVRHRDDETLAKRVASEVAELC
ncbi:MAG: serine hydroxymethyltransferase, partial [Pseudomonadota bacterium]